MEELTPTLNVRLKGLTMIRTRIVLGLLACIILLPWCRTLMAGDRAERKANILLLGTFHFKDHDFRKYPQDLDPIITKVVKFKPGTICVEWLPSSEKNDFYNDGYTKNIAEFSQLTGIAPGEAKKITEQLRRKINNQPDNLALRANLANALFISRDYLNACYQWYLIDAELQTQTPAVQEKVKEILPEKLKDYTSKMRGEIKEIAFPLARRTGLEELCAIDYRGDDTAKGEANGRFVERYKAKNGSDPFQPKVAPVFAKMNGWLEEDKANGTSTYYDKLNSDAFRDIVIRLDEDLYSSYSSDPDFKTWFELEVVKRNRCIFDNIVEVVEQNAGRKTLVLIGASHKVYLDNHFRVYSEANLVQLADL